MYRLEKALYIILLCQLFLPCWSQEGLATCKNGVTACRASEIATERLPDLNVSRNYHHTLMADGCPIVVGGHTDGLAMLARMTDYSVW